MTKIPGARCPLVKFFDKYLNLTVDISVNNKYDRLSDAAFVYAMMILTMMLTIILTMILKFLCELSF